MKMFAIALSCVCVLATTVSGENVIQPGLQSWHEAAETGRADILILGDSVVHIINEGWDAGVQAGFGKTVGLAGTGYLTGQSRGQGEGYRATGTFDSVWDPSDSAAFGSSDDRPLGQLTTGGNGEVRIEVTGGPLDPGAAYEYQVWAASGGGGGGFDADRRLAQSPWPIRQAYPGIQVPGDGATEKYTFDFDATGDARSQFRVRSAEDVTIAGQRLIAKGATGVTVTSWGLSGMSTLDFYNNEYIAHSEAARETLLQRLVDGGSGKLLVMVMEGFNDRNETETSLGGTTDGDSAQAFRENVTGLIDAVGEDWADAGFADEDLSFLTFGMYDIETDSQGELDAYREALEELAGDRSDISYIDLSFNQPDFEAGEELGYYIDPVHLSRAGALHYGDLIANAIPSAVPEPSSLFALAFMSIIATRTRRRA